MLVASPNASDMPAELGMASELLTEAYSMIFKDLMPE
jgi:hypothetical protein